jgi:DNA mismatch repair protein MutS
VLEYVADKKKIGAKTMFATHYHELIEMEYEIKGIKNYNVSVKKRGDDITFLRKIVAGGTDDSYGIDVANLAGVPNDVIRRAKNILKDIENKNETTPLRPPVKADEENQIYIGDVKNAEIIEKLKSIDPNIITPIEAMTLLYQLKREI